MDAGFWHKRWENDEIGFHEKEANPMLVKHFKDLSLKTGGRVFLPLCGKTLDIHWLLANGCRVAGAELSRAAVGQLFDELGARPDVSVAGEMHRYSADDIDVFVGDIFDLSGNMLGPVDAIYDRAALVALPEKMRGRYAAHLMGLTNKAPQLLVCYEYDQDLMEGPPFSVVDDEVYRHYGDGYDVRLLGRSFVRGGLRGNLAAKESVWLLENE